MGPSWEIFVQIFGALLLVVVILFCLGCYLCWRFDKATYAVSRYQSQYQRRHRQRQHSVASQTQPPSRSQSQTQLQLQTSHGRQSTVITPTHTPFPSNNIQMTVTSGRPNPYLERRTNCNSDQLNETELQTREETNREVQFQRQASHTSLQSVRRNRSQSGSRSLPSQSRRSSVSPRRGERGRVSVSPYHLSPATCSNSNPNSNTNSNNSSNFNLSSHFFHESNEGLDIGMDSDFNSNASRHSSDILLNVHINDNDDLPDYETVSEADEKSDQSLPSYEECISNNKNKKPVEELKIQDTGLSSSPVSTTVASLTSTSTSTVITISLPTISLQTESNESDNRV